MQILIKSGEGMRLYELRSASQRKALSPGMKQYSPPRTVTNAGRP
jgi:hypothetical protein